MEIRQTLRYVLAPLYLRESISKSRALQEAKGKNNKEADLLVYWNQHRNNNWYRDEENEKVSNDVEIC